MSTLVLSARRSELEGIIERGLRTFVEVGQALAAMRDERMYLETHPTFEEYCRARWDFSRQRALQLIDAACVTTVVVTQELPPPRNESVARQLAPLREQPEVLRSAWTEAVEQHGAAPTAKQVHEIVNQFRADPKPEHHHDLCPTCGARIPAGRALPRRS